MRTMGWILLQYLGDVGDVGDVGEYFGDEGENAGAGTEDVETGRQWVKVDVLTGCRSERRSNEQMRTLYSEHLTRNLLGESARRMDEIRRSSFETYKKLTARGRRAERWTRRRILG